MRSWGLQNERYVNKKSSKSFKEVRKLKLKRKQPDATSGGKDGEKED